MPNWLKPLDPPFRTFDVALSDVELSAPWQKVAAGLWGVAVLVAIGVLAYGLVGIARNRRGERPGELRKATKRAQHAGAIVAGLLGAGQVAVGLIAVLG